MRIKDHFVLREVAGEMVAVTAGNSEGKFWGMVQMNATGVFIWNCLQEDVSREEILKKMLKKYDIDAQTAQKDLDLVLERFREHELLIES